ncbi:MAG: hypothetical protein V1492_01885 [Candidatus Micrarchaeota archaeon]
MQTRVLLHPRFKKIAVPLEQRFSPFLVYERTGKNWSEQSVSLSEYWKLLSPKQKERAVQTVRKRALVTKLLAEPLNECAIAGQLEISRERIRQYKNVLTPERPAYGPASGKEHAEFLVSAVRADPTIKNEDLAMAAGLNRKTVSKILVKAGVNKRQLIAERIVKLALAHPEWTRARIGQEVGYDYNAISRALKKAGIDMRQLLHAKINELISVHPKWTNVLVAQVVSVSDETVRRHRNNNGQAVT